MYMEYVQWNLSIKDTLNRGDLSNEDAVCCPNYIELSTNLPLNYRQLGPSGVCFREVPIYSYICVVAKLGVLCYASC